MYTLCFNVFSCHFYIYICITYIYIYIDKKEGYTHVPLAAMFQLSNGSHGFDPRNLRGSFHQRPIDFDKICLRSKGHDAVGPLGNGFSLE